MLCCHRRNGLYVGAVEVHDALVLLGGGRKVADAFVDARYACEEMGETLCECCARVCVCVCVCVCVLAWNCVIGKRIDV